MKRFAAAHLGCVIVLVASSVCGQAPSYNENLKPLMPLIGKWTGDFTMQQDMGDLAKAGDTISAMAIYKWTKNRQAITLSAAAKIGGEWVYVTDSLIVF